MRRSTVQGSQRPGLRRAGWDLVHRPRQGSTGERRSRRPVLLSPDGSAVVEKAFPLLGPNGVGLSPDGRQVYAAETHTGPVVVVGAVGARRSPARLGVISPCVTAALVSPPRPTRSTARRSRRTVGSPSAPSRTASWSSRRTGRRPRSTRSRATSPPTSPSAAQTVAAPCSRSHDRAGWSRRNRRGLGPIVGPPRSQTPSETS